MSEKGYKPAEGSCIISEDVIATIASTAALEVPGVAAMAQRPATDIRGLMATTSAAKAVRVLNDDSETVLDVYINLREGTKIQEVCGQVQRTVKTAVQAMTGKPVTRVNVHVAGIVLNEVKKAE